MARPIQETPILKGQDAEKFYQVLKMNEDKKVSTAKVAQMKQNYDKIKAISKF